MAMTATLVVPTNVISGRPMTAMLTIANSGGSDVTVTSIQPIFTPSGSPVGAQPVLSAIQPGFPVGRTSTVTAAGTLNVAVDFVINFPQTPGFNMPGSTYLMNAIVTVSDGTVCTVTIPQWVSVSSGAPSPSQGYGQFRFDDGRNLINIVAL